MKFGVKALLSSAASLWRPYEQGQSTRTAWLLGDLGVGAEDIGWFYSDDSPNAEIILVDDPEDDIELSSIPAERMGTVPILLVRLGSRTSQFQAINSMTVYQGDLANSVNADIGCPEMRTVAIQWLREIEAHELVAATGAEQQVKEGIPTTSAASANSTSSSPPK